MTLTYQDCYVLLGLAEDARWDDVKRAYRRRASVWHPDKYPSNTPEHLRANEKFVELSKAYEMLQSYQTQHSHLPLSPVQASDDTLHVDASQWRRSIHNKELAEYQPDTETSTIQPRAYYTPVGQFSKLLMGLALVGGLTIVALGAMEMASNHNKLKYVPLAESEAMLPPTQSTSLDTPVITQAGVTRRLAKDLKRGVPLGSTSLSVGNSLNKQMNRHARDDGY